ncbi:MAG: DegT/DnrJ/EryC1/StrS family aminotransferase [Dehalococcoidia bacterium]|nr:DegT/DnrJ/EryC1/StrS family aminotransferase [Dehalococcoidia bacterium]
MTVRSVIPVAETSLGQEELNNATEAIRSGWISSQGPFIVEFEHKFAQYCGVRHGIATANGTVALHLALKALGIGKGDEVIVPVLTFIATANAVTYCNARPIFVDSDPRYWCIDPSKIERSITSKTRAIIPVHLYGHPCDMDAIMGIARRHNLYVIEDAAEAHGALYKDRKVGSFGHINCFSFFGNKIISTGEGGMCLTNDDGLAGKMRILRDHGMNPNRRYWYDVVGFNYRMTNLQAAVGTAQVDRLDELVARRRRLAQSYAEGFGALADRGWITLPPEMPWARSVYWMYSILVEDGLGMRRDEVIDALKGCGIETRPLFYPLHAMPPYRDSASGGFPVAEELSRKGLNLPSGPGVSREEVDKIVESVASLRRVTA